MMGRGSFLVGFLIAKLDELFADIFWGVPLLAIRVFVKLVFLTLGIVAFAIH